MIKIGLLGLGTVGSGVYEIINGKRHLIEKSTNKEIEISRVLVRNLDKKRNIEVDKSILTNDPYEILEDPGIDIIIEVMGGIKDAYEYIKLALQSGKHVVTANKAVLSEHLYELNHIAKKNRKALLFEASVAGGVPVIKALNEMIDINKITEIKGILNGTTNFILSKMTEEKIDFEEALKLAQELGYAEADPTDDIQGYDAARKMSILSSIAFDHVVNFNDVECKGITSISSFDIDFIRNLELTVKLVGKASVLENNLIAQVEPVLIDKNSIMANVENANNIVLLNGDIVGELQFYGQGAGKNPTANAVVSDTINVINNKYKYINFKNEDKKMKVIKSTNNYYFRVYLDRKEDEANILQYINKNGIKYNILKKEKTFVLVLQEISIDHINKLVSNLSIEDQSCYIKIDNLQTESINSIISQELIKFVI